MITNQRLIEVKDYLLDLLTHVAEVLATDITNEEYSHHADAIKNFIRKIRDNVLETNELTTSINRLRPILNKLLYDPNCKFHKEVFHALQIMTYVSPLNDYDNESSNYNSIITLVTFTDNNVFYSSSGYILHIQEVIDADMSTLAPLSYKKQFSMVEVEALAAFVAMNEFHLRKKSALLKAVASETVLSISKHLIIAYNFLSILYESAKHTANQARQVEAYSLSTGLSLLFGFVFYAHNNMFSITNITKTWAMSMGVTLFSGGMRSLARKHRQQDIADLPISKLNTHTNNILQSIIVETDYVKEYTKSNLYQYTDKINAYFKTIESPQELNALDDLVNYFRPNT